MELPQAANTIRAEPTTTTELWMEPISDLMGPSGATSVSGRSGVCMVSAVLRKGHQERVSAAEHATPGTAPAPCQPANAMYNVCNTIMHGSRHTYGNTQQKKTCKSNEFNSKSPPNSRTRPIVSRPIVYRRQTIPRKSALVRDPLAEAIPTNSALVRDPVAAGDSNKIRSRTGPSGGRRQAIPGRGCSVCRRDIV